MAYIQPNSVVQLFKGINLDNRYLHTIYFASVSAQNTWFSSKATNNLTFQQVSYVRYTANQIKLKCDATTVMDCTYLRFQNNRTVDMWYYAFITAVEYINENTALITFEIDVMQTWFIQKGSLRPCMIRRQHVINYDVATELEPEPIGSDIYEMEELTYSSDLIGGGSLFDGYAAIISTTGEPNDTNSIIRHGNDYYELPMNNNDMMIGSTMYVFPDVTAGEYATSTFKSVLNDIMGGNWDEQERKEDVLDLFMFPNSFCANAVSLNTHNVTITHPDTIGDYVPKNEKLFTYPYSYLSVSTMDGSSGSFRWELFRQGWISSHFDVTFNVYGNPIGGGSVICYPQQYQQVNNNLDNGIVMNNFPKMPYAYDAYQAWVASGGQTRFNDLKYFTTARGVIAGASSNINAISGLANSALGVGQGVLSTAESLNSISASPAQGLSGAMGGVGQINSSVNSGVQGVANALMTHVNLAEAKKKVDYIFKDAMYQPNQVVGNSAPALTIPLGKLDFHFFNVHVKLQELRKIDDFFSMYGYATNKVDIPRLTGRQYWNFIQTENCVVAGDMPATSKEAIGRIFDGGITFWHNGDNIGNYRQSVTYGSIDNPIV